jgi:hypothetical protein
VVVFTRLSAYPFASMLALWGCSDVPARVSVTGCDAEHIVGGTPGPTLVRLPESDQSAIVAVLVRGAPGAEPDLCSGVVIAPGAVLTARHCIDSSSAEAGASPEVSVALGSPFDPSSPEGLVDHIWLHPLLDVALLEVDWLEERVDLGLLPPELAELDASWVGREVELAGYGASADGELGTLAFAVESLTRIESDHLVVDGEGETGACIGDSGGPLLGTTSAGVRVLGVLDDGDPSCVDEDFYTRVDRLASWEPLARHVAPTLVGCSR